jgi:hypothetical protein
MMPHTRAPSRPANRGQLPGELACHHPTTRPPEVLAWSTSHGSPGKANRTDDVIVAFEEDTLISEAAHSAAC